MTQLDRMAPPRRRRVYLVRHGDVDYFDESGRPHRPDRVPLNTEGRRQVASLRACLEDLPIDRICSTGLPRTDETAAILAAGRGVEIETVPALQEIRPGRLADIDPADIEAVFLGAFSPRIDRSSRFLGGESFGEFLDRVIPAFRRLLEEDGWDSLLLAAHGGVNRAILLEVLGAGLEGFAGIEQDPAALNIIDVTAGSTPGSAARGSAAGSVSESDGSGGIVRLLNHTAYAPAKEGMTLTTIERLFLQYISPRTPPA